MQSETTEIHRYQTQDIDEQSVLLSNWAQEYRQLSCGKFIGNVSTAHGAKATIISEHTNQSLHQRVVPPADQIVFALVMNCDDTLQINRRQVSTGALIVIEGGREYDFRTFGSTELVGISMDRGQVLDTDGTHIALLQHALRQSVVSVAPVAAILLRHLWTMMGQLLEREITWPSRMPLAQLTNTALSNVLMALNMSGSPSAEIATPAVQRRPQVVRQAIRFMCAHLDQKFTIADVCSATHVSQRTLQYHFESSLGMSPHQYLKAIRLNAARALLRKMGSTSQRANIAAIAAMCGYEHPSRFAADYRRQFGTLPSETLHHAVSQLATA